MKPDCLWALSRAPAISFTHWVYKDLQESRLAMEGVNFFDEEWRLLNTGDTIKLVAKDGWTLAGISVDGPHVYLHPMSRTKKVREK